MVALQGGSQSFRLGMLAHEQAQIPRFQNAAALRRAQLPLLLQKLLAEGRHLAVEVMGIEVQQLKGRLPIRQGQLAFVGHGLHGWDWQLRPLQSWLHQGVQGVHQVLARPTVLVKPVAVLCFARG